MCYDGLMTDTDEDYPRIFWSVEQVEQRGRERFAEYMTKETR